MFSSVISQEISSTFNKWTWFTASICIFLIISKLKIACKSRFDEGMFPRKKKIDKSESQDSDLKSWIVEFKIKKLKKLSKFF